MTASRPGSAAPTRAILCMLAGGAMLTLNDGLMKWLTGSYPPGELLFVRGMFGLLPIMVFAWRAGGWHTLRIRSFPTQFARAACMVTAAFSFVVGLRYIPLADIVAVTFLTPVVITILAPLTLGERVGWHRWCAVAVGFAGVLVIARPAGGSLSIAFLLPLITVVANGVRDIITRRMSTTERSTATVAFTTVIVILVGLATVPFAWVTPNLVDLGIIAVGGLLFGTAHFLYIEAFRMAEATVVAPFRYFNLVWATGFGFLLFGTLPTTSFYAGAVLIVGSGLYIMYRDAFPR